jgi:hypothetical protein
MLGAASGAPSMPLVLGKSLGGRMASLVVDEVGAAGLVCLASGLLSPRCIYGGWFGERGIQRRGGAALKRR